MRHVLFVCHHNAGRSQMAAALLERHAPDDIQAHSAGTTPAERIWPAVVDAMSEIGIDVSERRPQRLTLEHQLQADWAITMGCGDACPYVPTHVEDWDVVDPADLTLERVREIRGDVERRVLTLLDHDLSRIRTDRTAHEMRLARLLPSLEERFGTTIPTGRIRACADEALARYDGAPIRSHIVNLASRDARACLAAGPGATCRGAS